MQSQKRAFEDAERYLGEAVRLAPAKEIFRFHLAVVMLQQEKYEEAKKLLLQLTREDLYPGAAKLYLGLMDLQAGRLKEGRKQITAALAAYQPTPLEWDLVTSFYRLHASDKELSAWLKRLDGLVWQDAYFNTLVK